MRGRSARKILVIAVSVARSISVTSLLSALRITEKLREVKPARLTASAASATRNASCNSASSNLLS
ncbi:MAG: hypothetical protein EBY08_04700 [Actinobacteria bacterium]|nr:hypothetical protein [Actinomycetota bacterium]